MTKLKAKKTSLIDITRKYANDEEACYDFFYHAKYPNGFVCPDCGCTECRKIKRHHVCQCKQCGNQDYLFANTIFQDNKLPLYKLILGLYLFFVCNKGISAVEMRSQLNVNIKTAQLLCRKCRILMKESNDSHMLDDLFYEADTAYIGAKSKGDHKQGMGTDKQPFLIVLSTGEENKYPHFMKLFPIPKDSGATISRTIPFAVEEGMNRVLNTDGKTTFNVLKDQLTLKADVINYSRSDHKLKWLNTMVGNVKNQITGIYHGISKRDLPLFLAEQEYRFNHRNVGHQMMEKIQCYIFKSSPTPRKAIVAFLNILEPTLSA